MRLFIGVNFEDRVKEGLYAIGQSLAEQGARGNFTRKENLHLTLRFLGERDDLEALAAAMARAAGRAAPFTLRTGALGTFSSNILWVAVEPCAGLRRAFEALESELAAIGVPREKRGLSPHVTIARKPVLQRSISDVECPVFETEVRAVTLFESARVNGRLTYTPLHRAGLAGN